MTTDRLAALREGLTAAAHAAHGDWYNGHRADDLAAADRALAAAGVTVMDRQKLSVTAQPSLLALADEWCDRTAPDDVARLNVRGFAVWADLRSRTAPSQPAEEATPIGEPAWHAHDGLGYHPAAEQHQPAPDAPLREAVVGFFAAERALALWDAEHGYVINSERDAMAGALDEAREVLYVRAALTPAPKEADR